METKLIELCCLHSRHEADQILYTLQEAGLHPFLRNGMSDQLLGGAVHIGLRIDLPEDELSTALEVLATAGLELPNEASAPVSAIEELSEHLPLVGKQPLEWRLWFILGAILLVLGLLIALAYLFNPELFQ